MTTWRCDEYTILHSFLVLAFIWNKVLGWRCINDVYIHYQKSDWYRSETKFQSPNNRVIEHVAHLSATCNYSVSCGSCILQINFIWEELLSRTMRNWVGTSLNAIKTISNVMMYLIDPIIIPAIYHDFIPPCHPAINFSSSLPHDGDVNNRDDQIPPSDRSQIFSIFKALIISLFSWTCQLSWMQLSLYYNCFHVPWSHGFGMSTKQLCFFFNQHISYLLNSVMTNTNQPHLT